MKRVIYIVILLLSISLAAAQYCPSPKVVTGERTHELYLNNHETDLWIKYNNNIEGVRRRAGQHSWNYPATATQAHNDLKVLEDILARIELAHEKNKLDIQRNLVSGKCKTVLPIRATGSCNSQVVMSPDWSKKVEFRPEGIYAAALNVITSGTGECSYFGKNIVPKEKEVKIPKVVITEEKGPYFDCNNIVPLALWSRTYTSTHKGRSTQFRVFSYQGWEIHCANVGGNFWELVKKVEYPTEYPVIQPAPVTGDAVGRIMTIKQLPEGQLKGVIARIDGKSPTRLNYIVKNVELRQGQKVKFVKSAAGLVTVLVPVP